jgi:curved DNA-binding protein CbpA
MKYVNKLFFLDKNPDQVVEAKKQFLEIRAAYEVLSDPRERGWYDAHRDVMLQKAFGDDYQDDTINIFPFFTSSCYQGYNDSENVCPTECFFSLKFSRFLLRDFIQFIINYLKILLSKILKLQVIKQSKFLNLEIRKVITKK